MTIILTIIACIYAIYLLIDYLDDYVKCPRCKLKFNDNDPKQCPKCKLDYFRTNDLLSKRTYIFSDFNPSIFSQEELKYLKNYRKKKHEH
jgi:hypothetical protein